MRSILGNLSCAGCVFNGPVACVYLGVCPRMDPVGCGSETPLGDSTRVNTTILHTILRFSISVSNIYTPECVLLALYEVSPRSAGDRPIEIKCNGQGRRTTQHPAANLLIHSVPAPTQAASNRPLTTIAPDLRGF